MPDLLIKGARVINPSLGWEETLDVLVSRSRISEMAKGLPQDDRMVITAEGRLLTPGFLDLHVHLREPGREDAETIASGLEAALRGGYTAVCCMPNTQPPLDHASVMEGVYRKARSLGLADLFPVGCITRARGGRELSEMALMHLSEAGVRAFSDDGEGVVDSGLMRMAMEYVTFFGGLIISHPEDPALSGEGQVNEGRVSAEMGLKGIPAMAEEVMVARDIILAEATGCRLHLAHVSTANVVRMIAEAKSRGVAVTAEATPHHLVLSEEDIPGYDTNFKVNPPLRTPRDVEALRKGLVDGTIDAVATDHAPHTLEDKDKEFDYAPFGVVGMESAFPVLYTELVVPGILRLPKLMELLTRGPARVLKLEDREYATEIREGGRADMVLLDLDEEWILDANSFASKGRNCPFQNRKVRGRVHLTIKNGKVKYNLNGAVRS
ncbi:MAG: dihydroorotase [Actinomycetota bacterium]|nr:dihydroorotase [Actinomycetota bacterium]